MKKKSHTTITLTQKKEAEKKNGQREEGKGKQHNKRRGEQEYTKKKSDTIIQ